jgi:hypothetical protein
MQSKSGMNALPENAAGLLLTVQDQDPFSTGIPGAKGSPHSSGPATDNHHIIFAFHPA